MVEPFANAGFFLCFNKLWEKLNMINKMADRDRLLKCLKACVMVEVVGFVLHTVGFATPYWRALHFRYSEDVVGRVDILIQGFDEGLWRKCVNGICSDVSVVGRDWLQAVRVIDSIAVITSAIATLLLTLYFLLPKIGESRRAFLISTVSSLVTGGAVMLVAITYGASVKVSIAWSFGFVVTGGACFVIGGILKLIAFYTFMAK